jgi:proline iminopeptidase
VSECCPELLGSPVASWLELYTRPGKFLHIWNGGGTSPTTHRSLHRAIHSLIALWAVSCAPANRTSVTQTDSTSATQNDGFITSDDGLRLYYRKVGSGTQTVIVPASLFLYRDLSALASGRRMIFYDMRGRGKSDRVADSSHISIQWDVRDLETVRKHFGVEQFVPIGWSYLGLMVMMYAAEHPEHVERVVQIGPVPRKYGTEYPREQTANDLPPIPDSAGRAEIDRLRRSELAAQNPAEHCRREYELTRAGLVGDARLAARLPDVCEYANEWPVNFGRHIRFQFVGSIVRLDVPWTSFAKVAMPVLTIHGTHDRNAPYGAGREWVSRLPNARLLTVRGAAHMPWIDQPTVVFPAIDQFLKGKWPVNAEPVAYPGNRQ